MIGRDGGLSTVCQRHFVKAFPSSGFIHSKDGKVVYIHKLYIYI